MYKCGGKYIYKYIYIKKLNKHYTSKSKKKRKMVECFDSIFAVKVIEHKSEYKMTEKGHMR
jgi:hypothetical protein